MVALEKELFWQIRILLGGTWRGQIASGIANQRNEICAISDKPTNQPLKQDQSKVPDLKQLLRKRTETFRGQKNRTATEATEKLTGMFRRLLDLIIPDPVGRCPNSMGD